MKNDRVVLDTNAAISAIEGDPVLGARLAAAEEWLLPAVVLGELTYGAYRSARVSHNLKRISEFAGLCKPLAVDVETAHFYGRIRTELRFAGRPIPINDTWIASLCRQHGVPLVTRDRHFHEVEGLELVSW